MPLVRIPSAFDHRDWVCELKHDGFRALAHVRGHQCELTSRRGVTFNKFNLLAEELAHTIVRPLRGGRLELASMLLTI